MKTFEQLHCRQKANYLSTEVFVHFAENSNQLLRERIFDSVLECACIIAESHWKSPIAIKDCLTKAKYQLLRFRSMLYLAKNLDYINDDLFAELYNEATDLGRMISWLISATKWKQKAD